MENQKRTSILHNLAIIIFLLVFQQLASKAGNYIADMFTYNQIDKNGVFAWISVHHIVQMLLALIAIWVIIKILKLDFRFRSGNIKIGLKYTFVFSVVILVYVLISYYIGYASNQIQAYEYPLNVKNVIGSLGFQLLLSGTSEEILFRALPITLLIYSCGTSKKIKIWKWHTSFEIIIAAFLFSLAHINWTLNPLAINADWFQLIYAFILGICYGVVYQKSESIIYPMTMHSLSNVIMVGVGYIFAIGF